MERHKVTRSPKIAHPVLNRTPEDELYLFQSGRRPITREKDTTKPPRLRRIYSRSPCFFTRVKEHLQQRYITAHFLLVRILEYARRLCVFLFLLCRFRWKFFDTTPTVCLFASFVQMTARVGAAGFVPFGYGGRSGAFFAICDHGRTSR